MLIEAVSCPVRYQWPGGEIKFEPGQPIRVEAERGKKILKRCENMVRTVQPNWLEAWRDLAELTESITKNDSRFHPICDVLNECDFSFQLDDWLAFHEATKRIHTIINNQL